MLWPSRRKRIRSKGKAMVLLGRIELPTSSLPMTRSTTELQQQYRRCGPMRRLGLIVKRLASLTPIWHRASSHGCASGERQWQKMQRIKSGSRASGCAKHCAPIYAGVRHSPKPVVQILAKMQMVPRILIQVIEFTRTGDALAAFSVKKDPPLSGSYKEKNFCLSTAKSSGRADGI